MHINKVPRRAPLHPTLCPALSPSENALEAARLAAYYSAARHEAQALVDVTERRHVRHIKGGRPGMVTYSHERTITASPAAEGGWEE